MTWETLSWPWLTLGQKFYLHGWGQLMTVTAGKGVHFSVWWWKCFAFPYTMCQLLESCTQNICSTVKTPTSLKKTKLPYQTPKLTQKPRLGFFQLHKYGNKPEQQPSLKKWPSTQRFPNKISCMAYAARALATRLMDGVLWIKRWHKTQTVLSWH